MMPEASYYQQQYIRRQKREKKFVSFLRIFVLLLFLALWEISARTGIDGKAVLAVLEGFMNEVKTSLGKEENVYLRGFGSFIVKKRAQKTAWNISKNTTMIIPAHNIPAFKPSDEFLKMVKQQNA